MKGPDSPESGDNMDRLTSDVELMKASATTGSDDFAEPPSPKAEKRGPVTNTGGSNVETAAEKEAAEPETPSKPRPTLKRQQTSRDNRARCHHIFGVCCGGEDGEEEEDEWKEYSWHKYHEQAPCGTYCCLYCMFWIFLPIMIAIAAAGGTVIRYDTAFPFYIQSHRTFERQDGATQTHKDATYAVVGTSAAGLRGSVDDDTVIHVLYIADSDNMLTTDMLQKVQQYEDEMAAKPDWEENMCWLVGGVCYRPSSATYFYSDDSQNPVPFFPMDYDPYPSYNNTKKFEASYYSQPINYDMEVTFDNPDSVSKFWARYGLTDMDGTSYFQYFDTTACLEQVERCNEVQEYTEFNGIEVQNNSCVDRNDMFQDVDTSADTGVDLENCTQTLDFMESYGLDCDDMLVAFNNPNATTRMFCCESCFYRWFPEQTDDGTPVNSSDCGASLGADALLELCLNYNKGSWATFTYAAVTGANSQEIVDAIAKVLGDAEVIFDSIVYPWESQSNVWKVNYPWSTEQTGGYEVFESSTFPAAFDAALPDGATLEYDRSSRETISGKTDVFDYEITSNPFFSVTDGDFGESATLDVAAKSKAIRSTWYNGLPIAGYETVDDDKDDQLDDLGQYCYDSWQDHFEDPPAGITVYWYCRGMDGPFTMAALQSDQTLMTFTILFILFYMAYTTGSFFLALNGMSMIFANFVPCIFLYRYIWQQEFFGILQVMSMFLILSIGADDIFVMIDTWGQNNCQHPDKTTTQRLSKTLGSSSEVMLTTSLSTIFSFVVNVISVFPAIATFGMFCATLIFVNYCAVCIFYPAVLYVHEIYFDGAGWQTLWWGEEYDFVENNKNVCEGKCKQYGVLGFVAACCCRNSCMNCGCRFTPETLGERHARYRKDGHEQYIPNPDEKRAVDMWFHGTFYHFVHRARIPIILIGTAVFCFLLASCARIQPDPEPPNIYPPGHNYGVFWEKFTDYFSRETSDLNVVAWIVFGLQRNGIIRGDNDPTDVEDLGDPKYDVNFNPFSSEGLEFLCAFCDDLESGERYGDSDVRLVDSTQVGAVEAVQCPFTAYRDWIWGQDPEGTYDLQYAVNPRTKDFVDENLVNCMIAEGGTHTPGTWPISGFWNIWYRWEDWLYDTMPVSDPEYTRGKSNYEHWSDQLWYIDDTWSEITECAGFGQPSYTPKMFQVDIRLSVMNDYDFDKGITLYENWEAYVDNWLNGVIGRTDEYVPSSTHCEGLEISDCENTDGCTYSNSMCAPTAVTYPGAAPEGLESMYVTDAGYFSYYYLQETLIAECLSGIAYALVAAFIILNFATGNYVIATIAAIVISMIVVMIIGFTVAIGWKLGIIESVIYVMVVGMSVDYVVHLGEAYIEGGEEHADHHDRVAEMLETRGMSVLSGAISTLGGIFFLFFAFIVFMQKFAIVIFFLIFISIVYSLFFFAAIMDTVGPNDDFGEWHLVYKDLKLVWSGDMELKDCCLNCIVPHDSKHRERVIDEEEEKMPQM